jgi:hypothetical protein
VPFFTRQVLPVALSVILAIHSISPAQEPQAGAGQMYKLTIVDDAATTKRVRKGRVSSQAVVKVTDQNDVPVAGIAVLFTIPQFTGGGTAFANGAATSMVTTNTAGLASSGPFETSAGSSFNMSVSASTPGGTVTTTIPISIATAAAAGGVSTGVIVAIIVGVGAAAGAGIALGLKGGGNSPPSSPTTPVAAPSITIGGGTPTFGKP